MRPLKRMKHYLHTYTVISKVHFVKARSKIVFRGLFSFVLIEEAHIDTHLFRHINCLCKNTKETGSRIASERATGTRKGGDIFFRVFRPELSSRTLWDDGHVLCLHCPIW